MQKYGIVQAGKLIILGEPLDGYKPVQYADIPDSFDQLTQCVVQGDPVDDGNIITVGVVIEAIVASNDTEMV